MDAMHVNEIAGFLDAYSTEEVKAALKIFSAKMHGNIKAWKERVAEENAVWRDIGEAPLTAEQAEYVHDNRLDWRIANGRVQVREFTPAEEEASDSKSETTAKEKPKADLSMQPTDKICIHCGGTLAYEPICPGCRLGRIGFKGRFVCMEDMDHEFYVLREGIILPNQGD